MTRATRGPLCCLQGIHGMLQRHRLDESIGLAGTEACAVLVDGEADIRRADDLHQLGFQRLLRRGQLDAALTACPKARGQRAGALLVVCLPSAVPARESPTRPRRESYAPRQGERASRCSMLAANATARVAISRAVVLVSFLQPATRGLP